VGAGDLDHRAAQLDGTAINVGEVRTVGELARFGIERADLEEALDVR
jgi:hypothetical protein